MNKQLRTLIVEDNPSFALEMEMMIDELGHELLGIVDNSGDALVEIMDKTPDLIIMDIEIKGKLSGTEIAAKINHLNIPIVFATSFTDEKHYLEAKQTDIFAYLIKPVKRFELERTIDLLLQNAQLHSGKDSSAIQPQDGFLLLKKNETVHKVAVNDILFVESDGNYCISNTRTGQKFTNRIKLSEFETLLKDYPFKKSHRSYLVNTEKIDAINLFESVIHIGEHQIPLSRNAKSDFVDGYKVLK